MALLLVFVFLFLGVLSLYSKLDGPLENEIVIDIPKTTSLINISKILQYENIISSRYNFIFFNYLIGTNRSLKAGEYLFSAKMSQKEIVEMLVKNKVLLHKFTVPECYSNKQILDKLERNEKLTGYIEEKLTEGDLFPNTYLYAKGTQKTQLIEVMKQLSRKKLNSSYKKIGSYPEILNNLKEVVILASLIEAEAKNAHEKERIASVFINRLKKGMRLQSDPTVIYGLVGSVYLGRKLTRKDMNTKHPWNTYKIFGLPPSPICNVGIDSIEAVLKPLKTNDLYFVADGLGGHYFSQTLEQHNEHVKNLKKLNE